MLALTILLLPAALSPLLILCSLLLSQPCQPGPRPAACCLHSSLGCLFLSALASYEGMTHIQAESHLLLIMFLRLLLLLLCAEHAFKASFTPSTQPNEDIAHSHSW